MYTRISEHCWTLLHDRRPIAGACSADSPMLSAPARGCRGAVDPYPSGHTPPWSLDTLTPRGSLSLRLSWAAWAWLSCLPPSLLLQSEITHDEFCAACKRGSSLQPCGTCSGAYHLSCLDPPLKTAPKGVWLCPKCQRKVWAAGLTPHPCTLETVFWVIPSMGGAKNEQESDRGS